MPDASILTLITQYGVPVALLIILLYWLRQGTIWLGTEVVKPVAAKHIAFMDSSSRTAETNAETLQAMSEQNKRRDERDEKILGHFERLQCFSNNGRRPQDQ